MLVLSIECSSPEGSVALVEGGRLLANQSWSFATQPLGDAHQHSELLIPSIRKCLQFSSRKLSDINLVAVGNGPGRFTGIRVAINAAKAIAYSLDKPIISFSSLEILAASVPAAERQVVAIANAQDIPLNIKLIAFGCLANLKVSNKKMVIQNINAISYLK